MIYELLKPLDKDILNFIDSLPSQSLGKKVTFFSGKEFDDYNKYQIAIIGLKDNRGCGDDESIIDIGKIRKAFYSLYPGNWGLSIVDFGDVLPGESIEDTYFLIKKLVADLVKNNVLPIIIGGSQDMTYGIYRGYETIKKLVNIVSIDSKLDIAKGTGIAAESFLSRIILEEPVSLLNFSNLGYQTYFNSQEEIDLIESLYFEAYRIGEILQELKNVEPILRDADIISLDMNAVKSSDSGDFEQFNPNGFDGREICALARYSGLSDRVSSFGIFNYNNNKSEALLIAQIIWYFIEGVNYRTNEYPFVRREHYLKYIVPVEGYDDFIFYKSNLSDRWWVEVPIHNEETNEMNFVLPCSYKDYEETIKQEIPERWWRILRRSML